MEKLWLDCLKTIFCGPRVVLYEWTKQLSVNYINKNYIKHKEFCINMTQSFHNKCCFWSDLTSCDKSSHGIQAAPGETEGWKNESRPHRQKTVVH